MFLYLHIGKSGECNSLTKWVGQLRGVVTLLGVLRRVTDFSIPLLNAYLKKRTELRQPKPVQSQCTDTINFTEQI